MAGMDLFVQDAAMQAPGAPEFIVRDAVRNAAIDLCRRASVWWEVQSAQPYLAGTARYTLSAPTGAQVVGVRSIIADSDRTLVQATIDGLVSMMPDWESRPGRVLYFAQAAPDTIVLVRVPETDGTIAPKVIYTPSMDADALPDVLYSDHYETIVHGALWRLKTMAEKQWASASGVQYHMPRFFEGVNRARIDTNKNGSADLHVAPRFFA